MAYMQLSVGLRSACFELADTAATQLLTWLSSYAWDVHRRVVPNLLRAILPLLPLEKARAGTGKKGKGTGGGSASRQPQPVQQWNIVQALQQIGQLPPSQLLVGVTCHAVICRCCNCARTPSSLLGFVNNQAGCKAALQFLTR